MEVDELNEIDRVKRMINGKLMDGLSRSACVVISAQINVFLAEYLSLTEILLTIVVTHALLSVSSVRVRGFGASVVVIKSILKSIMVQNVVDFIVDERAPWISLLNLVIVLVVAECLPAVGESDDWMNEDVELLKSSISYIFSDQVSALLRRTGVPLGGAALGLCLGGEGLIGQTMVLTGINSLCAVVFGAVDGGGIAVAWPVGLLYFVQEVSRQFDGFDFEGGDGVFLNYGLYKASDATYGALVGAGVSQGILVAVFGFLAFLLHKDEVWTGVCVLVLIRAASDWFLGSISLEMNTDPVLGGLSIVTVIHFASVAIGAVGGDEGNEGEDDG